MYFYDHPNEKLEKGKQSEKFTLDKASITGKCVGIEINF